MGEAQTSPPASHLLEYGTLVEHLVANYNLAQEHEARVQAQFDSIEARLAADKLVEDKAISVLRDVVLASYMNGAIDAQLNLFQSNGTTTAAAQHEYEGIASEGLKRAIATVKSDERQTRSAEAQLLATRGAASTSQKALAQTREAAQTAVQSDILLAQVDGNLSSLLASASQEDPSFQQAQEQSLTSNAATNAPTAIPTVPSTLHPRPGRYLNPLRGVEALRPSRIDQGVDYMGYGPIYAIGAGVVLSTANSGWPGGTFISYRLTAGRASGLVVYVAEDLVPLVSVGQNVTPQTVLGTMYEGPTGIETGWADPTADGSTLAGGAGQFRGSNSTVFGSNISQLLAYLGAPPGVEQAGAPRGILPPNWPEW